MGNFDGLAVEKSAEERLAILEKALRKIVDIGDQEWEHMYGMEHGNGLSMGIVMCALKAAKALKKAGLLDKHPILQAKVLDLEDRMKWG